MATEKLKCTNCGKLKATEKNFYMSHSQIYSKNDGRIPICKACTIERYDDLVEKYGDKLKALQHLCMNLDIYYNNDLAISMYSNMKEKDNLAKVYFSKVNSLQQYKGLTSFDSDIMESYTRSIDIEEDKETSQVEFEVSPAVVKRWGKGLSEDDYFFLETTYDEFTSVYDDRTPAQKLIFRQIAKALLEGEKAIKANNTAGFEKMNNLVSKLMNDGNIKPIQEASIAEDETQGWGIWVNRIETERPIGEACEQFKDADRISKYITRWFTKQMQRVFDLKDEEDMTGGEEDVNQN